MQLLICEGILQSCSSLTLFWLSNQLNIDSVSPIHSRTLSLHLSFSLHYLFLFLQSLVKFPLLPTGQKLRAQSQQLPGIQMFPFFLPTGEAANNLISLHAWSPEPVLICVTEFTSNCNLRGSLCMRAAAATLFTIDSHSILWSCQLALHTKVQQ